MKRDEFEKCIKALAESFSENIVERSLKAFDALTPEEIEKLTAPDKPYLLARTIIITQVQRSVNTCFMVDLIKKLIPRINRILNRRYY